MTAAPDATLQQQLQSIDCRPCGEGHTSDGISPSRHRLQGPANPVSSIGPCFCLGRCSALTMSRCSWNCMPGTVVRSGGARSCMHSFSHGYSRAWTMPWLCTPVMVQLSCAWTSYISFAMSNSLCRPEGQQQCVRLAGASAPQDCQSLHSPRQMHAVHELEACPGDIVSICAVGRPAWWTRTVPQHAIRLQAAGGLSGTCNARASASNS